MFIHILRKHLFANWFFGFRGLRKFSVEEFQKLNLVQTAGRSSSQAGRSLATKSGQVSLLNLSSLLKISAVILLLLSNGLAQGQAFDALDDPGASLTEEFPHSFDVLTNDLGELDTSSLEIVSLPSHGLATANLITGNIDYIPNADYVGLDQFDYAISDTSGLADTATVSFIIFPINDPPFINSDIDSVLEDASVLIFPLTNDNDSLDGGTMSTSSLVILTPPVNGFTTVNPVTGTILYNPFLGFTGVDSLEYQVCDNGIPFSTTMWFCLDLCNRG